MKSAGQKYLEKAEKLNEKMNGFQPAGDVGSNGGLCGELWNVYSMPSGEWAAFCIGTISDGFPDSQTAKDWCLMEMDKELSKRLNA